MQNTIKKIGSWLWNHRKIFTVFAVVLVFFGHPALAHAADDSETVKSMGELANLFVKFLNTLLWPLLIIIGDLLDVDMITGPGMEERLIAIWVEMRNLVNIAIALVLIVVAFYNVLGLGGGEGELAIKTVLPKIVLGLILVNFTYVGGKVILDVANVGTTIAFSLPQIMEQTSGSQFQVDDQLANFEQEVCYPSPTKEKGADGVLGTSDDTQSQGFYSKEEAPIQTKLFCELEEQDVATTTPQTAPYKDEYGGLRESLQSLYFRDLNKNNIAIVMAVNMGSLGSLELFKSGAVETFTDLTVNTIFALVMYSVFAISYVVLAAVLVVRLVVLWLALALSPVAVLMYVVPQLKEWIGGGGDFTQKVVKHLVAPIIIGLTLSMGFMLMDGWSVISQDAISVYSDTKVSEVISSEFLVSGIDDLPKLILAIASIVVVWMGVFAAASDTYAAGLTDKIKDFGGTVKEALFNAPMVLSTLPISVSGEDKEGMSPMALKTLLTGAVGQFANGNMLPSELKRLSESDSPLVQFALGNGGRDRVDPDHAKRELQGILNELDGSTQISNSKARDLAGYLASAITGSKTMNKDDQKAMVHDLMELKNNPVPPSQRDLQEIVSKYTAKKGDDGKAYDAKDFNINASDLSRIQALNIQEPTEDEKPKKKEAKDEKEEKKEKPETSTKTTVTTEKEAPAKDKEEPKQGAQPTPVEPSKTTTTTTTDVDEDETPPKPEN